MTSQEPPKNQALSDAELSAAIENAGSPLEAMEILENQTRLREADALAYAVWLREHKSDQPEVAAQIEPEPTPEPMPVAEPEIFVAEPEPQLAAGYATGSFEIIESVEQAVETPEDFDYLLSDSELPWSKEGDGSLDKPISTIERRSKPISQLFVWSSITVGITPLLLAGFALRSGLSLAESLLGMAIGLVVSAAVISVIAIAGKRSGLPTLIIARSVFGVRGNVIPSALLILLRLLLGGVIIVAAINFFDGSFDGLPKFETQVGPVNLQLLITVGLLAVASLIAFFGGKTLYWVQVSIGAIGLISTIAYVVATVGNISLPDFGSLDLANFVSMVAVSSVVITFFGGFWVQSVADFTRKIPMRESGTRVALFVALATGVIPMIIATYGLIAITANLKEFQIAAAANVFQLVLWSAPTWAVNVLLYSALASLLGLAASWLYSSSVSLASIGMKIRPAISQPILVLIVGLLAWLQINIIDFNFAAVVILAWAGVFVGDVALRRIAYHEISLTRDYGFYGAWNLVNLLGFFVASAVGFVLLAGFGDFLASSGYVSTTFGNIGLIVAPVIGMLFPLVFSRGRVRKQEAGVLEVESRRRDLMDVEVA